MSLEGMITQMEKLLGTSGRPNVVTNWYADRNGSYYRTAPWCDMSISWAAHKSENRDAVLLGGDVAYTVYHAQRFADAGQWHEDIDGIRRGDIVFFDWQGSNRIGNIDHVGLVTGTDGRNVFTIEGNTSDRCLRRVRTSADIVGYGRPAYAKAPTPAPPPKPGVYVPPPFPKGLRPGSSRPSAKGLQRALKAADYMPESVRLDDMYGPLTQAAVRRFHAANPSVAASLSRAAQDPAIGPRGWAELHREAYS